METNDTRFEVIDTFTFENEPYAILQQADAGPDAVSHIAKIITDDAGQLHYIPVEAEDMPRLIAHLEGESLLEDAPPVDAAALAAVMNARMQGPLYRLNAEDGSSFTAWPRLKFTHKGADYAWLKNLSDACAGCPNGYACFDCPHHNGSAIVRTNASTGEITPALPDDDLLRSLEFVYYCELDGEFDVADHNDIYELFRNIEM